MSADVPLVEFDADTAALIEPQPATGSGKVPERAVICFFRDVIAEVCREGRAAVIATFTWEHGTHQLFDLQVGDRRVAVFHPGVGAPLACGLLEQVIATGCRTFVACGGAGAVVPGLELGHVVIPDAAVRDEGTSYHYLPASREVSADPAVVAVLRAFGDRRLPRGRAAPWRDVRAVPVRRRRRQRRDVGPPPLADVVGAPRPVLAVRRGCPPVAVTLLGIVAFTPETSVGPALGQAPVPEGRQPSSRRHVVVRPHRP